MSARKPYVRPMAGWWRRNPVFMRYMVREASAVFLAIYAVSLLLGVFRLSQGAAAYDAWLAALRNPLAVVFHGIALLAVGYHAYTWWKVMPKTLPMLHVGGRRVPEIALSAVGWAAWLAASLIVYALVRGL
ncbi:MAG: fumarate reductase subunit C [Betaproteobacteria bacterium]|nr:fumarate reductase subunit C [Betaproteobacteria bacterium]